MRFKLGDKVTADGWRGEWIITEIEAEASKPYGLTLDDILIWAREEQLELVSTAKTSEVTE